MVRIFKETISTKLVKQRLQLTSYGYIRDQIKNTDTKKGELLTWGRRVMNSKQGMDINMLLYIITAK